MIKVGTSRADITPPVGMPHANWGSSTHQVAEGIDMPMYCNIMFLESESNGDKVMILDLDLCIIRPSLVYGPNVKGNLKSMLNLINKGIFPPLPKVNNRRSMIHVDDLVLAIFLLIKTNSKGKIFNATDNNVYSSRSIYESLCFAQNIKPISWSIPKILFDILGLLLPSFKKINNVMFNDSNYDSKKLSEIGFRPKLLLTDINKSLF